MEAYRVEGYLHYPREQKIGPSQRSEDEVRIPVVVGDSSRPS
jgi:hypothetical protein